MPHPSRFRLHPVHALILSLAFASPLLAKSGDSPLVNLSVTQWALGGLAVFVVNAFVLFFLFKKSSRDDDQDGTP